MGGLYAWLMVSHVGTSLNEGWQSAMLALARCPYTAAWCEDVLTCAKV